MFVSLAFAVALGAVPVQDGPIVTAPVSGGETAQALRIREAIAYADPLPRGAPADDYALVAWCEALVAGHVRVGESLNTDDDLDQEIMRLGRLEAADFRDALNTGAPHQSEASRAAAAAAAQSASSKWDNVLTRSREDRNQVFGMFYGLPGRCEHAARRVRDNITAPPATPSEVGLE